MPPPPSADPAMPHRTTVALEYDSEGFARVVERSIAREVGQIDDDRSTTRLARDGRVVELAIDAADLVALRAAANTWLSLADVAERVAATAAGEAAVGDGDGDGRAVDDGPATDRGPETGDF